MREYAEICEKIRRHGRSGLRLHPDQPIRCLHDEVQLEPTRFADVIEPGWRVTFWERLLDRGPPQGIVPARLDVDSLQISAYLYM